VTRQTATWVSALDQRPCARANHCGATMWYICAGGRRHTNLDVVLGAQLQEAFQTPRRVLRTLAFVRPCGSSMVNHTGGPTCAATGK